MCFCVALLCVSVVLVLELVLVDLEPAEAVNVDVAVVGKLRTAGNLELKRQTR